MDSVFSLTGLIPGEISYTEAFLDNDTISEEGIRKEVDRAIDTYAEGGAWLPCFPSIIPVYDRVFAPVIDECNRYGRIWLENHM